jgi:hypothetical protein
MKRTSTDTARISRAKTRKKNSQTNLKDLSNLRAILPRFKL